MPGVMPAWHICLAYVPGMHSHAMACHGMHWHAMACHGMPRHAMACQCMPWHAMACHCMPWNANACHGMPRQTQLRQLACPKSTKKISRMGSPWLATGPYSGKAKPQPPGSFLNTSRAHVRSENGLNNIKKQNKIN